MRNLEFSIQKVWMRLFYQSFPIRQTLSDESKKSQTLSAESYKTQKSNTLSGRSQFEPILSWSHYCELLKIEDPLARSFYEKEAYQNNWSVREIKRQINSMLFERLALSKDTKAVMQMAKKGQILEKPKDAIKDPYILKFLIALRAGNKTETQINPSIIRYKEKGWGVIIEEKKWEILEHIKYQISYF